MRLTINKQGNDYDYTTNELELVRKLGQLEDIEDELGIDLITLFKALKDNLGILVKNTQGISRYTCHSRSYLTFGYDEYKGWYFTYKAKGLPQYFIKDYGKTWALTKEELIDEKERTLPL